MKTEMNEFENLAAKLTDLGYFAVIHRQGKEWFCTLANAVIRGIPCGRGRQALHALKEADECRLEMETDKQYQKKTA